ncbi:MAG TPA: hypothetical protein VNW28_01750 [Chthoniobacterales bacterium]|jgi:hypothetical protein|nr:hypothetical protein [Chthoniobacterales bacterium]
MKHLLPLLCLTTLLLGTARAEDAVPAVELKQKSNFDAANARDPFWPIGWKRPNPKNPNTNAGPDLSPDAFALTSVTTGTGGHFAILNGKIIQEGQQFGLQLGAQVYQVTLRSIEDGQVVLVWQENEIVVPLRRK